jgi:hypothetical protein
MHIAGKFNSFPGAVLSRGTSFISTSSFYNVLFERNKIGQRETEKLGDSLCRYLKK